MVFCAFIIVSLGTANLLADTINVPDDYPTIQDAIDHAQNSDTVLVSPGTYVENIDFKGKVIVVSSHFLVTGDPSFISQTIIDGGRAHTVTFANGEDVLAVLCGFTITGESDLENGPGLLGGILISGSSPTVRNNVITGNLAEHAGGGILIEDGSPTIRDNIITQNVAGTCGGTGGGIAVKDSANPLIIRNTITQNLVGGFCDCICYFGGGIWVDSTSSPVIGGSELYANNISSNFADAGFLLYREGSGEIINAQYNYWGSCPPNLGDVFPESEFDVSNCLGTPVSVDDRNKTSYLPRDYKLSQNFPNPFNPVTTIRFEIPYQQNVELAIYDILGREVKLLYDGIAPAGLMVIDFNAQGFSGGVYIYRLKTDEFISSKKLIILK